MQIFRAEIILSRQHLYDEVFAGTTKLKKHIISNIYVKGTQLELTKGPKESKIGQSPSGFAFTAIKKGTTEPVVHLNFKQFVTLNVITEDEEDL